MVKVIRSFHKCPDSIIQAEAQSIVSKMNGNPYFPTSMPPIVAVKSALDAFVLAQTDAVNGGKEKIAFKNQKRATLLSLLSQLGNYVSNNSNNKDTIALTSGYKLAKKRTAYGELSKPEHLLLSDGENPGEINTITKPVAGAKSYFIQYTPDPITPESVWACQPSSKSRVMIKNLPSVKRYWFRSAAIGTSDVLHFTEPVSRVVQ